MHLSFCEFKEPVPFYCILPSILKYGYCIRVRSRRIAITMTRWFVIVHEAKFKRKSVTRYFDLLFFLFLFYIFYSFLLFLSLPSTVESKTKISRVSSRTLVVWHRFASFGLTVFTYLFSKGFPWPTANDSTRVESGFADREILTGLFLVKRLCPPLWI